MANVQIATRVPEEVKREAERVTSEIGIDLTDTIRVFVTQIAKEQKVPFFKDEFQPRRKRTLPPKALAKLQSLPRYKFVARKDGAMMPAEPIPDDLKDWIQNG